MSTTDSAACLPQFRAIDPKLIATLAAFGWIKENLNVLITGPFGVGKSFIASALAHAACRADYSVRSYRLPRLIEELGIMPRPIARPS